MKKLVAVFSILLYAGLAQAQNPVTLGQSMPDFTLRNHDGTTLSLSEFKGKNVLILFPRGRVGDHWCQICHYQYAELAMLEKEQGIRKKYDLEILFILPYDLKTVESWVAMFPEQLKVVEGWKNPANENDPRTKSWMERARILFPRTILFTPDAVPTPFPILSDGDRQVSMNLGLFTTFWDRSYVEQNISTILLLDRDGVVQFKYISQTTTDRPKPEYLFKIMDCLLAR